MITTRSAGAVSLLGLVLATAGGCAFVLDNSEARPIEVGDPHETMRLLQEKLGYLQQAESKLRDGLKAANASSTTSDEQKRDMEVRLLEARARRVDVQLELARWQALARTSSKSKSKGESKSENESKSESKSSK